MTTVSTQKNSRADEPADFSARQQALDPTQSFAVTAPAGSGKTSLLTQRVLKLLAICEQPEQVLAITFTRKAAQEMQHRILSTLRIAQNSSGNDQVELSDHEQQMKSLARAVLQRDKDLDWNLLLSPHRLRIQTIDSFCQSLIQQLPLSAGSNALLETTESANALYQEAVQELLLELNKEDGQREDLSKLLLHMDTDISKLQQLLVQLLQSRGQWLASLLTTKFRSEQAPSHAKEHLANSLRVVITEKIEEFFSICSAYWPSILASTYYAATNLREKETTGKKNNSAFKIFSEIDAEELADFDAFEQNFNCEPEKLIYWQALAELLTTSQNTWRKTLTASQGFPTSTKKSEKEVLTKRKQEFLEVISDLSTETNLLDLIEDIKTLPSANIADQQWDILDSLTRILPRLVAHFNLVCAQRGQSDFNSITDGALRALGDDDSPSDLALKLDYQIQHILVDEFQDTSSTQLQLLEKLTAGWQPGDGRTLFIVGDAMQSCYGFRDANVGIFMDARTRGIGAIRLSPLDLSVNFRSKANIVEWVNQSFSQAFPLEENIPRGAVPYSDATPFHSNARSNIEIIGVEVDKETDKNLGHNQEAIEVLKIVERHLASDASESIVILARTRSHLQTILQTLRQANVQWQAKDVDPLAGRMAVIDLLSLTRGMLDLSDRVAWLSILRAPWCGLSLHDLSVIGAPEEAKNETKHKTEFPLIWQQLLHFSDLEVSASAKQILNRIVPILEQVLKQQRRKPLRQWLEGTWLALGGSACVGNPEELFSVDQYFSLLEYHSSGGKLNWQTFEEALDKLYDKSDESSRLQVMTIHKAKGLEFDTVIIPGLTRKPRHDDNALLLWQNFLDQAGNEHVLLSPLQQIGDDEDSIYQYLKREKNIRNQLESTRLLYIGCTRAISNLYLLGAVIQNPKTDQLEPTNKSGLINSIWPFIRPQVKLISALGTPTTNEPAQNRSSSYQADKRLTKIVRLPPSWQAPTFEMDTTLAPYRAPASYADNSAPKLDEIHQRQAQLWGTLLHSILQHITLTGYQSWNPEKIRSRLGQWSNQLLLQGYRTEDLPLALERLEVTLIECLADTTAQWILDNSHLYSACELEILAADGHRLEDGSYTQSSYIIDRAFMFDGSLWVIDYKSSQPVAKQSLEDFLQQESSLYRPQLSTYSEVIQELHPNTLVKAALYFPLVRHLEKL